MQDNITTESQYMLRLFITGASPNSISAVHNVKAICETYLPKSYHLEIIDIYQKPWLAESEELTALPLLLKLFPLPVQKLIGNMSDTNKVLKGLRVDGFKTSET